MGLMVLALTFAVGRQPVALVVEGRGDASVKFAEAMRLSGGFILRHQDAATALRELREQRVAGIITIPADFDDAVERGEGVVDVLVNNVDLDFADDIRRTMADVAVDENSASWSCCPDPAPGADEDDVPGATLGFGGHHKPNPYRVGLGEYDFRTPDIEFLQYQLVPLLALLALTTGTLVTALAIAGDREAGTLRLTALAPAERSWLAAGRLLAGSVSASALIAVILIPARLVQAVHPPPGRWPIAPSLLLMTAVGSTRSRRAARQHHAACRARYSRA